MAAALDTRIEVETPEGIHLYLLPAGLAPRALAWLLDFLIRLAFLWVMSIGLAFSGRAGHGVFLLILFVLLWLYPILFELFWQGQTPGKKVVGLRVVNADGTPVGWVASTTRNLLRAFDMLPLAYAFGVLASLFDPRGRRLGDMAAGTLVVHVPQPPRAPQALGLAAVDPPPALARAEREALLEFAERHAQLSGERQIELAQLLQPITGASGEPGLRRVLGMAVQLMGERREPR
jgi:uncharacterized RDD family membrane protein YckC